MRTKAPFIGARMSSRLPNSPYYPIGLSLEDFRTLYYSVHSFNVEIFTVLTNLVPDDTNTVIIGEQEITTSVGVARRRIRLLGELNSDGSELSETQKPFVNRDYPTFLGGSGGGIVSINFGRSLFYAGLYFPEIYIQMSNDVNSLGGVLIGSVRLDTFGEIPMYKTVGFQGVCVGSINIKERYDTHFGSPESGGLVTIQNTGTATNDFINEIDNIYLNNKRCDFTLDGERILVTIPDGSRSGSLLAESLGRYNYYRFPFIVKVGL